LELVFSRQRLGEGAQRGGLTGPNPTDRGKLGTKRHVLTDGRGVPVAVTLTGANIHDKWLAGETLDAVPLRAPRGPRRPRNLCLDKGYDYDDTAREVTRRGIRLHLRRRGEKARRCKSGRPRRWVVERTNSWHNNFRALRIRWETIAQHYLALVHFACAMIAYRAATRRNGHRF
jgi:putative transposase